MGFRRGEQAALQQVYLHYFGLVLTVLRHGFTFQSGEKTCRFSGCNSTFDAEELLQEVFRRAFEEPARLSYDGLRPYKNFLLMIARNHVIDELRRQRKRLAVIELLQTPQMLEPEPTPEDITVSLEFQRLLETFCAKLESSEQQIFETRFVEQLDQEQTASKLSLSVYKVRTVERSLRKQLLLFLRDSGYVRRNQEAQ